MTTTSNNPVHVLLVDDLEENLLALEGLLRRDGLVLLLATSGPDALELLLKHEIALALVDVQMPGMDGFELAELMHGSERTRRVPIIFFTAGNADRQRRFRGYGAGAVDFLQKPIEPDILKSKVEVFIELYCQRREVAQQRDELRAATIENTRLLKESRQHAAALKEADRQKDEFLAMLAHELRNPLAPVRNAVELLQMSNVTSDVIAMARDVISRQVAHMARLIDDLLDVARIARGKIQLRTEACDLTGIVRQTAEDYRLTLSAAGVHLQLEIPAEPLLLQGDPTRLSQVVGNLLHNAAKFTPAGGDVSVRLTGPLTGEATSRWATLLVRDTGAGLSAAVLPRLFEPFAQADQMLDRQRGGLGLGLALVKGLTELHGGTVRAESAGPDQGATFTVRLPLSEIHAPPTSPRIGAVPVAKSERLRILLVEDNRDAARTLQMLLSFLGHAVTVAFDGLSGLSAARAQSPDVLISDLGLPGELDGYAFARAVRADAALQGAYLIALSGYGQENDRRRTQEAGFNLHLIKPVDLAALKAALASRAAPAG